MLEESCANAKVINEPLLWESKCALVMLICNGGGGGGEIFF